MLGAVVFVLSLLVMAGALVRMEVRMYSSRRELERMARELRASSEQRRSGEHARRTPGATPVRPMPVEGTR